MVEEAPKRFCPLCGNPVSPADIFCGSCGNNISMPATQTFSPYTPRKQSKAALPIVVVVVLIVFILIMLNLPQQLVGDPGKTGIPGVTHNNYGTGYGNTTIVWKYDGDTYTLKSSISQQKYLSYVDNPVPRRMTSDNDWDLGLQFITSGDSLILAIATELSSLKNQSGLDRVGEANMVLAFVQTIPYAYDNVTYGQEDYWAFPVETLFHGQGDCEDKSFLYSSIMVDLHYDCALLFFSDHVAVGAAVGSVPGGTYYLVDGNKYYYCETTSIGWTAGDKPVDYGDSHVIVI